MGAEGDCLIKDGRMTLASMLRDSGYATAMVGKWHLGMDFPGTPKDRDWSQPVKDMPLDKGFEYFFGIPASLNYGVLAWFEGRHAKVPPTVFTAKKPNKRHLDYRIKPPYQDSPQATQKALGKKGMEIAPDFIDNECLTRFTDKAIDWMQSRADEAKATENRKPFFLYLPFTSPHYPVCPKKEFWGKGECGGYGEFMIETDYHVGRILEFLSKSELDDNTLIVFTSDNGPEKSWRQRIDKFQHYSSGPYRGGKRDIYEGGHRVPFFVRWPAGIQKAGRACDDLVGQIDVFATLAELVEFAIPDDAAEDSQSFATVLKDADCEHQRLPLVNHANSGRFSATEINSEGNWKWIAPYKNQSAELYDLAKDPSESTNLAEQHGDIANSLEQKLTDIVRNGRTTAGARRENDTGYWKDLTWMTEDAYIHSSGSTR